MREKMRYILRLLIVIMLNVFIIALLGHVYNVSTEPKVVGVLAKIGSRGDEVRAIQEKLAERGLYKGEIDGVFESGTANALKRFQRQNGLTADGIAGPATLAAMGLGYARAAGSDYRLLAELISAEAGGASYLTQVAVGAVALNRVEHPSFPDTIAAIAYQPGAFPGLSGGVSVTESAYRAAKEALNGVDPTGGALYYYTNAKTDDDVLLSRKVHLTIGDYVFCS